MNRKIKSQSESQRTWRRILAGTAEENVPAPTEEEKKLIDNVLKQLVLKEMNDEAERLSFEEKQTLQRGVKEMKVDLESGFIVNPADRETERISRIKSINFALDPWKDLVKDLEAKW